MSISSQTGQSPDEQQLVTIGQIVVTNYRVITPNGEAPVAQTTWTFQDMSITRREMPAWAIVCAIIFFLFCFLGLLFLLAKEERTEGFAQVQVQGPGLLWVEQLRVGSPSQIHDLNARVNFARSIAAQAGGIR